MDYEKRYKQLHTLISDLYPLMSEYCKEKVEGFFPELAGSKDERIRKALLEMVHDTTGDELWIDYNVHKEEALAWLEKQGEKEIDKWKEGNIIKHGGILALVIKGRRAMKSNGEIFTVQYPDEWVKAVPNEIEHFLNELEKQGEKPQGKTALEAINEEKVDNQICVKKPTDKVEPKFKVKYAGSEYNVLEVKDSAGITFYGIEDEPNHIDYVKAENCEIISGYAIKENGSPYPNKSVVFFGAKDSTWSEKDEMNLEDSMRAIKCSNYFDFESAKENVLNWLKTLKDRVQPQNH